MDKMIWTLATIAAGMIGGMLFVKLKFPAGAIVGALAAVGLLNILTGNAYMPGAVKVVVYAVSGMYIGLSIDMETVRNLRHLLKPAVIMICLFLVLCICVGLLLYTATGLDIVTSLFSVAPGGITDMTLMTLDLGGDAPVVAVIQTLRLLSVYCISMPLVKLFIRKENLHSTAEKTALAEKKVKSKEEKRHGFLLTAAIAVFAGAAGYILAVVTDFMIIILLVTMAASAAANISTGKLYLPTGFRTLAQLMSGCIIGLSLTYESLVSLKAAIVPSMVACCGFVIVNIILAFVLRKTCGMNMATALLSSAAGGSTEAALVASEFGGDPCTVSVLQITRVICTTATYPIVVKLLCRIL